RSHHAAQPNQGPRPGHPVRPPPVRPGRAAVGDGAEATAAGADVAQDHERGGAVLPALADVRAARLLAHRVEVLLAHQRLQAHVARSPGGAHLEPGRLAPRDTERRIGLDDRQCQLHVAKDRRDLAHYATATYPVTRNGAPNRSPITPSRPGAPVRPRRGGGRAPRTPP